VKVANELNLAVGSIGLTRQKCIESLRKRSMNWASHDRDREAATSRETLIEETGRTQSQTEREQITREQRTLLAQTLFPNSPRKSLSEYAWIRIKPVPLAESALLIRTNWAARKRLRRAACKSNALYASGDNKEAVRHHDEALQIYSQPLAIRRKPRGTLSSSIQPLILMASMTALFKLRSVPRNSSLNLRTHGESRASINAGNIFHRQDRFEEALAHYERAYAE